MALEILSQKDGFCVSKYYLSVSDKRMIASSRLIIFALVAALVILTGCRQRSAISDASKTAQISLVVEPSPPVIGETVLIVTLENDLGEPIEGASLQLRGDMSHAGMTPEFAEVETADGGKTWEPTNPPPNVEERFFNYTSSIDIARINDNSVVYA